MPGYDISFLKLNWKSSFQMQSTLREHKDNVGGLFNRYNISKVSWQKKIIQLNFFLFKIHWYKTGEHVWYYFENFDWFIFHRSKKSATNDYGVNTVTDEKRWRKRITATTMSDYCFMALPLSMPLYTKASMRDMHTLVECLEQVRFE